MSNLDFKLKFSLTIYPSPPLSFYKKFLFDKLYFASLEKKISGRFFFSVFFESVNNKKDVNVQENGI